MHAWCAMRAPQAGLKTRLYDRALQAGLKTRLYERALQAGLKTRLYDPPLPRGEEQRAGPFVLGRQVIDERPRQAW